MLQTLRLSCASLLLAFPGLPNWTGFHNPLHHRPPAAVDSLPPAWKPASRLALEDQFVLGQMPNLQPQPTGLKLSQDPRQLRVSLDPDTGRLHYGVEFGDVTLGQALSVPLVDYSHEITALTFERIWQATSRDKINTMVGHSDTPAAHTGLSFAFPSPLPRQVQSLLGPGGPALNVSGSEQIRLSGTSNWTNQQIGILGQHKSLFPSLDMQQDLNIVLEGQLSDRVRVNLLQNSAVQIPLANRIAINYKGDEDDLIQELDLGNTNLTLPGTQYVSYSGRNEGLFGAKVSSRMGPLDVTLLASKQEGRSERASFAGGSQQQTQEIADLDYVRGVYYFLYDPSARNGDPSNPDPASPWVYELQAPIQASIQLFLDEGVYANTLSLSRGRAWLDPRQADPSRADTAQVAVRGNFRALQQGTDYDILTDVYGPTYPVIRLKRPLLGDSQTLAVYYKYQRVGANGQALPGTDTQVGNIDTTSTGTTDTDGRKTFQLKLLRAPQQLLIVDPNTGFYPPDTTVSTFNSTRELELKNFYQLGGQKIAPLTFQMAIRHGDFQPYAIAEQVAGQPVPYIEVLGLDNYDQSSGVTDYNHHGHDGKVDGTGFASFVRMFVNFDDGTLFFPDLRPFAPRIGTNGRAFENVINSQLFRRDALVGPPDSTNEANPSVYDKRTVLRQDRRFTMMVTFTASQVGGEIPLGRTNIIEGSEVVTVNGQPLVRDRDYKIDYDLGKITLIRQLGPSDNLNVDYGYAPLFQQAGRTLLGSAFSWQGLDTHFGGAFMYESRGASELRPRIGEEPSRSVVGDLNGEWHAHPAFVTRLVDALPGVRTTAPSEFNLSAEVGLSIPNPNTANVVYLDDMESVRDAVTLGMSPERWYHSSIPFRNATIPVDDPGLPNTRKNTEVHWYSPVNAIKERDLNPNLEDGQGAQNAHQSLAISLPKRPAASTPSDTLWTGLTYVLDPVGLDLSRAQFIEFQVNDFRDYYPDSAGVGRIRGRHVKVHIDIGTVSEDQQRAPNIPPNGVLDTEDQPPFDNQLSVTDQKNEDTGLDGYLNKSINDRPGEIDFAAAHHDSVLTLAGAVPKPDLVTVSADDPAGDNFQPPDNSFQDYDPRKWLFTNGTEDDHTIVPVPETEDLNGNTLLDTSNNYFEYTIDLGAPTPYLIDSAYVVGRNFVNDGKPVPADNGWRHYRIPIADVLRQTFGAPDLTLARHVRVWLDGVYETDPKPPLAGLAPNDGRPFLVIGELSIVGSRWYISDLDSVAAAAKTNVVLSSVNSLDNADIYTPPFDPGRTVNGSQGVNRREQSISLTFQNLLPADSIEVYRTFSLDEDYSRYGTLGWFASGFKVDKGYDPTSGTLQYFIRFASDEIGTSYYEYRAPLPVLPSGAVNWQDVQLKLTDLSNLKLDPRFPTSGTDIYYKVPGRAAGTTYIIKGRPSFTRLRRISFGLVNTGTAAISAGSMWLDEMRALDIQKEIDHAQRVTLNGKMANLLSYNFNYNGRGPDFQSVGETRGTGNSQSQMNLGLNMDVNRFFEGTGIILPVGYSYSGSKSTPRFTAGDDVVRTGATAAASETRFASQTWTASYSRAWSDRSNPFLRFTLGGLGASIARTVTTNVNPSVADTNIATAAGVTYLISPRSLLPLPLPMTKTKLFLLPERFFWNYTLGLSEDRSWSRLADATGTLLPASFTKGRTAFIDFGASFRPIDLFRDEFQARRNLTLPDNLREQWGFINLGKVIQWRHAWDTRYAFQRTPVWLRPSFSWNGGYSQNNGLELSPDLSIRNITNAQNISMNYPVPLDRMLARITPRAAVSDSIHKKPRPSVLRWLFGMFGPLTTDTRYATSSNFNHTTGTPSFWYVSGLSRDPGFGPDSTGRVQEAFGFQSNSNVDWGTTANTRLTTGYGSSITTTAEYGSRTSISNGSSQRSDHFRFPDLDVDYGRIADVLHFSRVLSNVRLRTAFGRTQQKDYLNSDTPTTITTSSEWRPFLGLQGDFKSGLRTELRIERRVTVAETRLFQDTYNTDRNTDVNFSLSRSYSQGQKVNILGKTSTVRTSVSLGMTAAYSRRSGDTRQVGVAGAASVTSSDRLSVNGTGSYGFSSNMTGNVEFGFLQDRNLQTAITNRSVRVELRGQLTF